MKIAALSYACTPLPGWVAHETKLSKLITAADADLIVLPEYAAVEAALVGGTRLTSVTDWRDLAADRANDWVEQFKMLAAKHKVHILAGSGPVRDGDRMVNRAWLISPRGEVVHQDKLIPTPYERGELGLSAGDGLRVFDTDLGRIGILICYDSEFPLLARAMTQAGAELLLVPSCTDTAAGQTRVRQSCRARAIENQVVVVQAPLVGEMTRCEMIDINKGRAGIFTPADIGLPDDGIAAQGAPDVTDMARAELDPRAIASGRMGGQVHNYAHWPEQFAHLDSVILDRLG